MNLHVGPRGKSRIVFSLVSLYVYFMLSRCSVEFSHFLLPAVIESKTTTTTPAPITTTVPTTPSITSKSNVSSLVLRT